VSFVFFVVQSGTQVLLYDGLMKRVELLIDDETDELLTALAEKHNCDKAEVLQVIARANSLTEAELEEVEAANGASFAEQVERSEKGFREGRFTTLEEVKRRAGL
jgi:hypothetical protein